MNKTLRSPLFLVAGLLMLAGVILSYSGHYNNPFHFDDDHTIVTNQWVKKLDSFPRYFTDSVTSSSLPANQAYRPGVTLLHAIDYRLSLDTTSAEAKAKLDSAVNPAARQEILNSMMKPKPFMFHVHIFIGFVLSGFLLFLLLLHIFRKSNPGSRWNEWLALFGAGWFWLHTANAETINYVSARSDSASTFWVLLTFVLYIYVPLVRRYHLYLLTMITAFFIKEPGIIFAPLLVFFIALFSHEEKPLSQVKNMFPIALTFITAIILYWFSRKMTPVHWTSGGTDPFHYLLTESFVIFHYLYNFILPVNLSADTDWAPVTSIFDDRVFAGAIFIGVLIYLVVRCWKNPKWRPVSFGIIWFFLALAPTSSIFPFAEVLNDHRTYFPYIGLIIASVWTLGQWLISFAGDEKTETGNGKKTQLALQPVNTVRAGLAGSAAFVFLLAHGIGTYVRCDTWSSSEKLWSDCVKKSPNNGRAWMHYGMAMFDKGNKARLTGAKDSINYWYDSANVCYTKSDKLMPMYSYLQINWGVLRQWQGKNDEAEKFYRNALAYNPGNPESYYYLADLLRITSRQPEALVIINQGLQLSPFHEKLNNLKRIAESTVDPGNPYAVLKNAQAAITANAKSDDYLILSLAWYNLGEYEKCIEAAQKAVQLDNKNFTALNNIISADNQLGRYEHALETGKEMLRINPKYDRGIINLSESDRCKRIVDSLEKTLPAKPNADQFVTLSLAYYNTKVYPMCINAAQRAIALNPNYTNAWVNICTSYNVLMQYDLAIPAGEKAFALDPKNPLTYGNLNESKKKKQDRDVLKKLAGL